MSKQLPAFLTAEWRNLVMLNYEIDPAIVKDLVPKGTEIDFWNGRTYVSVVGFRFLNTRLLGLPIPFHRHFDEVNLRFYVRRKTENEWRRGVVFVKEIVPLPAVASVARWVYNENYVSLPMRHQFQVPQNENEFRGSFHYSWNWQHNWIELSAQTHGEPLPLTAGSEAEFITEHYWGYTRQRDGGTIEYGVEHPSWRTWNTTAGNLTGDVASLYGSEFGEVLSRPPTSMFVADGSPIVVRKGTRLS
jgi:uncharacterized protein YqjF (DUF2071 family)